jgi:hypothetical protein
MYNEVGKRPKFTLVAVIAIAAALLLGTTAISTIITAENVIAYESNQAKSDINDCGNGSFPENVGCQNIDSQIQGDENAVALTAQQTFPSQEPPPPPPPETATLIVSKIVECADGRECPGLPTPQQFSMFVQPSNGPDPDSVPGSAEGIPVKFTPGEYDTIEKIPVNPAGLFFVESTKSEDCDSDTKGPILVGQERECTITNTYAPTTVGVLKVITNVECTPEQECPNLPVPGDFTITMFGNDPIPAQFSGSANGVLVTLGPGEYGMRADPFPRGTDLLTFSFSSECDSFSFGSFISAGEVRTCTMTFIYTPR